MTARQIVRVVKYVLGKKIGYSLKSKSSIVRKAEELFIANGYMDRGQAIDIHNMTARQIVKFVKGATGTMIKNSLKSKKTIIKKAEQLLELV